MHQEPMTFDYRWERAVHQHAGKPFLLFRDDDGGTASWTYAEFDTIVSAVAATLSAHGLRRGSAVHIALRNCPAFIAVWLAAARLGAVIVPVDPASTAYDVKQQVERTSPVLGICAKSRHETYQSRLNELPIIALDETAQDLRPGSPLVAVPGRPRVAGEGLRAERALSQPCPTDRLAIMFTSGTTSQPKGVVLTQHNYAHVADTMATIGGSTCADRWLVTLPLFHANAQYYCFAPAIAVGASVALTARFSASRWLMWARDLAATHASLFAAPIRMILARTPADEAPARLQHVWFAQSLAGSQHAEFAALVGCAPRQLYGMTETVAVATADLSEHPSAESIGDPTRIGRRTRIVDPDTNQDVPPGTPGMLLVGGTPGEDLFLEYLDDLQTTRRSFLEQDGETWLRTSDLVVKGPNGVLKFVGRVDDVIKVAGENVSLTELEAAIARAPGVLEVAVLPEADPIRDTVPIAFVVARDPTAPPRVEDLAVWAADNLTPQSRPRSWSLVPELPRTSVGKIRRSALQMREGGRQSAVPQSTPERS